MAVNDANNDMCDNDFNIQPFSSVTDSLPHYKIHTSIQAPNPSTELFINSVCKSSNPHRLCVCAGSQFHQHPFCPLGSNVDLFPRNATLDILCIDTDTHRNNHTDVI